ncbi:hypothetical protein [Thalassobaculum sp.]|uniref:hypothetical protein n=1 Tax=Thalassobaculum sp. TaxID=2022740 RepID=UPI0032EF1F90
MLDQTDYANLERHIAAYVGAIETSGLRLRFDDDPAGFAATRAQFEGYVHPALDPVQSRIPPGSMLWLEATDASRRPVGCTAMRRFDGERLADLIWSRRIWGDRHPRLQPIRPISLLWPRGMPEPAGRLVYSGGLYLDRAWRNNALGIRMVRLLRALVVRDWHPDWVFGLSQDKMAIADFPRRYYGYTRTVPCFNEATDFGPRHEREWLSMISLDEIRGELDQDPYRPDESVPPGGELPPLNERNGDHPVAAGQ